MDKLVLIWGTKGPVVLFVEEVRKLIEESMAEMHANPVFKNEPGANRSLENPLDETR